MDFGCASYCQYAEQCLGTLPPELVAQKENLFKDRVAVEVKRHLKTDFRRIGKATRVARHAEQLGRAEEANLGVILAAALLHDVEPDDSPEGAHREALTILGGIGAPAPLIDEVSGILAVLVEGVGPDSTTEARIVRDAILLSNIEILKKDDENADIIAEAVKPERFLTDAGKAAATELA